MSGRDGARVLRSAPMRYLAAVLASAVAVGIVLLVDDLTSEPNTLAPYIAAVVFGSWYGGLGPGLLATALNSVLSVYFSLAPVSSFRLGATSAVRLGEFIAASLLICGLNAARDAAQRRIEAARAEADAANRAKDQFLAIVTHELRTPLTSILGWSTILRNPRLPQSEFARGLEMIERNTRAQAQIIEELLDLSRIRSGKLKVRSDCLEVRPVIEAAVDTVRPAAQTKRIELETDFDSAGSQIIGDAGRLQQVFWNLLTNAIKFTPEGGHVGVSTKLMEGSVQVSVSDTGIGISPEFLPHVFERFTQGNVSDSRSYGGLGLGLAIVRELVEIHGGTAQARSAGPGQGATFVVRLPLANPKIKSDRAANASERASAH